MVRNVQFGRTAVHLAAQNGKRECVELLLEGGADVHAELEVSMDTQLLVHG